MNEIVNKFLLAGDKFMPEMHLRQPQFVYSEFKNLKKQEVKAIFTKTNWIKHAFNMIWLMDILKIYQKELQQITY